MADSSASLPAASLSEKVALVTGGVHGIGWGCAWQLARRGATVIVNDLAVSDDSARAVLELQSLGGAAAFIAGDVFEEASSAAVVQQAIEQFGRIDILVSCPAFSRRGEFLTYPRETFEKVVRGTLTAGFSVAQFVARHMVERGGRGKIVFISSVHANRPYAGSVAYNAAKAGLDHMAATIAAELIPHRINVNVINPGWIDTPGERRTFGDQAVETEGRLLPWQRIGTPDDIGHAAAFLCSEEADYITGTTLVVDGGFQLRDSLRK